MSDDKTIRRIALIVNECTEAAGLDAIMRLTEWALERTGRPLSYFAPLPVNRWMSPDLIRAICGDAQP